MDPLRLPIQDVLDLHAFRPEEISDLLDDYLDECVAAGIFSIRVIHGKGSGVLRRRVQSLLGRHRLVAHFRDAPPEAGGWGATLVDLCRPGNEPDRDVRGSAMRKNL